MKGVCLKKIGSSSVQIKRGVSIVTAKKKKIPSSLDLCDLRSEKKLYNPSTKSN